MTATAPQKHHRRSIRLEGYDYTQPGAYFVTVVTWRRESLFGEGAPVWQRNYYEHILQKQREWDVIGTVW